MNWSQHEAFNTRIKSGLTALDHLSECACVYVCMCVCVCVCVCVCARIPLSLRKRCIAVLFKNLMEGRVKPQARGDV